MTQLYSQQYKLPNRENNELTLKPLDAKMHWRQNIGVKTSASNRRRQNIGAKTSQSPRMS